MIANRALTKASNEINLLCENVHCFVQNNVSSILGEGTCRLMEILLKLFVLHVITSLLLDTDRVVKCGEKKRKYVYIQMKREKKMWG